ncbi:MAG TPA: hypothetical protein VGF86_00665 [Candidatus Tumulicola sp.]|jgi:hypothetical protein
MKHPLAVGLGGVVLIFGLATVPLVSTAAPDPAPTPVAMARPDLSPMTFLTGTWTCTQMLRGKPRPDTSTTTVGMDGAWMITQDTAPPFDQYRTFAIKGTTYTTYDSATKQWIQTGVDSAGGYGTSTSPGWQGNVITWTAHTLDGTSGIDVLTKVSNTQTTDDFTATDTAGKVTKTTTTCTKSAS